MSVLVSFALPDDEHVGRVASLLAERGVVTVSCSPVASQQIGEPRMGWSPSPGLRWELPRLDGGGDHAFAPKDAVFWFRNKHTVDSINTRADQLEYFELYTRQHFLAGFVHSEGVRAINVRSAVNRAAFKLHQLRKAPTYGLRIPRTLISSNKEEILEFVRRGPSVVKPLYTGIIAAPGREEGPPIIMMTSRLTADEVAAASSSEFSSAPVIVQEEISKAYELRVVVFGNDVLAYKIDSQKHDISKVDWRWGEQLGLSSPCQLSPDLEGQLRAFLAGEGLDTGVFDLIVDTNGETYFLECNPSGQWGMLEDPVGQEIATAFAENIEAMLDRSQRDVAA